MICEEVIELMQRHLDDDLNNEEHKQMRDHLDACPECAEMMERLVQIDQDLGNLPKVTPSFSLVDAILPQLHQLDAELNKEAALPRRDDAAAMELVSDRSAAKPAGARARRLPPFYRSVWAKATGVAAAAAVLGVMMVNGLSDSFPQDGAARSTSSPQSGAEQSRLMESAAADNAVPAAPEPLMMEKAPKANEEEIDGEAAGSPEPSETPTSNVQERMAAPEESGIGKVQPEATAYDAEEARTEDQSRGGANSIAGTPDNGGRTESEPAVESEPVEPEQEPIPATREDPALQDGGGMNFGFGIASVPETPEPPESVASDDGAFTASVLTLENGESSVVLTDRAGETVFESANVWKEGDTIRLDAWSGAMFTYTVYTEGEERSFRIDAEAGTETGLQ